MTHSLTDGLHSQNSQYFCTPPKHHKQPVPSCRPAAFGRVEWSADLAGWSTDGLTVELVDSDGNIDDLEARVSGQPDNVPVFFRILVNP